MLGQFTWKQQPDGGLDFSRADGAPLVVMGQSGSFGGNSFEDVVDETVHDGHGFGGDSGVWVDLLQDFVDVDGEALLSLGSSLFVAGCALGDFLDSFRFWCHFECLSLQEYVVTGEALEKSGLFYRRFFVKMTHARL